MYPRLAWKLAISLLSAGIIGMYHHAQLVFFFFSYLHILDTNPLSDMRFPNIFSHFIGCLFILLIVSFAGQKSFGLMWSDKFIFTFVICAFGVMFKNSLPMAL
jgi:NADH:ubiquinone oxidoreductase subunit K